MVRPLRAPRPVKRARLAHRSRRETRAVNRHQFSGGDDERLHAGQPRGRPSIWVSARAQRPTQHPLRAAERAIAAPPGGRCRSATLTKVGYEKFEARLLGCSKLGSTCIHESGCAVNVTVRRPSLLPRRQLHSLCIRRVVPIGVRVAAPSMGGPSQRLCLNCVVVVPYRRMIQ